MKEVLDSIGINGMEHTKTCYTHRNFCYGMVVFLVVVCPFFSVADQHDTGSEFQETSHGQNQNPAPLTQQDLRDVLSEQQETFVAQHTVFLIILGFLLLVILIFLLWMFFQYRALAYELDNVKHRIEISANVNSSLKQDVLDVGNRIQRFAKTFDSDVLYQKLAAENENNTQKVLNLIKPIIDRFPNGSSTIPPETTESSEQHRSRTGEGMLSQAVVDFCACYNAAIKDRQEWTNFIEHYEQNYKIDVVNAEERYLNLQVDIDPIFKTNSAGCFLACYIEAEKLYAVVPVYDLVVERSTYTPGAFGEVFKCSHFDDRRNYQITELFQPAIFEPDNAKETWTIKKRGMLELRET